MAATHARRQTAKSKAKVDETHDLGVKVSFEGDSYVVRLGDIPASVGREFRRQVGMSVFGAVDAMATDPDIDIAAAFVWLGKVLAGEKGPADRPLSYDDVASVFRYDSDWDIEQVGDGGEGEARGGPMPA